jgi:O-succinylbenzoate synthase
MAGTSGVISPFVKQGLFCTPCDSHLINVTVESIPDLPIRLQKYVNEGILQKDIPDHIAKDCNGQTVR